MSLQNPEVKMTGAKGGARVFLKKLIQGEHG